MDDPLNPAQATAEIRRIVQGGSVRYSQHALDDAAEPRDWAHDVSDDEIDNCLRKGAVRKKATRNEEYDEWSYSVEFAYDVCDLLVITVIVSAENRINVITRYKQKRNFDKRKPAARKPRTKYVSPKK